MKKYKTPAVDIEVIKQAFVDSLNEKLSNREEVLENLKEIRNFLSGGEKTLQQQTALWQEGKILEEQIQALIMQNAQIAMDQEKYQKEFDEQLWISMEITAPQSSSELLTSDNFVI